MPTLNDANGTPQRVQDNGFALCYSANIEMTAHACDNGDAYTAVYNMDPNVAGDFLYIKNASDMNLRIYKIKGYIITTGGLFTIKTGVTGTPTTGVEIVPINSLVGSGKAAEDSTFNKNTSGASMALTGGSTYDVLYHAGSNAEKVWDFPAEITLTKNQTFCMTNATDPTSVMIWTIYFYYHEIVE